MDYTLLGKGSYHAVADCQVVLVGIETKHPILIRILEQSIVKSSKVVSAPNDRPFVIPSVVGTSVPPDTSIASCDGCTLARHRAVESILHWERCSSLPPVPPSDSKEYACSQVLTVASEEAPLLASFPITDIDDIQGLKGLHLRKDFISGFQVRKLHRPWSPVSPRRSLQEDIRYPRGFYILRWRSQGCGGRRLMTMTQASSAAGSIFHVFVSPLLKISPSRSMFVFQNCFRGSTISVRCHARRPPRIATLGYGAVSVSAAPSFSPCLSSIRPGGYPPCLAGQQPCLPAAGTAILRPCSASRICS